MKKKETALLLENWRKFIKENSDEDENIFRSFGKPKPNNNVLDKPNDSESENDNFYASNIDDIDEPSEEESDDREHYLRRFCELVGINCDDKQELANYFADQAAKSGVDTFGNEFSNYSKRDVH